MTELAVTPDVREKVLGIVEETLRGNWIDGERDGVHFGYSRPSDSSSDRERSGLKRRHTIAAKQESQYHCHG